MDRLFQKYLNGLETYVEAEQILNSLPSRIPYQCVCVIPLAGEFESFLNSTLPSLVAAAAHISKPVLVIAVVNSSEERSSSFTHETNLKLLNHFCLQDSNSFCLKKHTSFLDICVLNFENCSHYKFKAKEGVGLARKIGADLALYLMSHKKAQQNYIYNTDGDAVVPVNYFEPLTNSESNLGAWVYPFTHKIHSDLSQAQAEAGSLYDYYLRYFCEGLKYSGSHFQYIPIGSCLLLDPIRYAQVRGFPNRLAGEDFYILSKIAKISDVRNLESRRDNPILLESRLSDRVPFGTGATLIEWTPLIQSQSSGLIKVESPNAFWALKILFRYFDSLCKSNSFFEFSEIPLMPPTLSQTLQNSLSKVFSIKETYTKLSLDFSPGTEDFAHRFLIDNFDSLKQLRFLHELSDSGEELFKKISLKELSTQSPESHFVNPIGDSLGLGI
jgi:hypothetical protein